MIIDIDIPEDATPKQRHAIERRADEVITREQEILAEKPKTPPAAPDNEAASIEANLNNPQ